jgi:uncharacterized protein YigE (DUF2233 family)
MRITLSLLFSFLFLTVSAQKTTEHVVKNSAFTITHAQKTFDIYVVNYNGSNIQLCWKNDKGEKLISLDNLKKHIEKKGKKLLFATNAGIYLEDNSPQGLYIENSMELRPLDKKKKVSNANFYMQPNGVFSLTRTGGKIVTTDKHIDDNAQTLYATQSGPMLVINGKVNNTFRKGSPNNGYIRSGVGINAKGQIIFAISNTGCNFYDFATLFKNVLNCNNALYMDGAICRSYIPAIKRYQLGGNFGAMIAVTE